MPLLKNLSELFRFRQEARVARSIRTTLMEDYRSLARLAKQIRVHADYAPYPFVAERLRQIAGEKERSLAALEEKIERLGGRAPKPDYSALMPKNHWARMSQDVAEQNSLKAQLIDDASYLAVESPESNVLIRQIVETEAGHERLLMDLLARADPQATQT